MMPESPRAAARIAAGDCLNCNEPGPPGQAGKPWLCSDVCKVNYRMHHGCGDEPDYCGACHYELAVFCLFTDGGGIYCGAPVGHTGLHRRRLTPTRPPRGA
jgi:hypothetical protein